VIGFDQVLVEPAWKNSMDDQADLFKEKEEEQRRIPVAEKAEDANPALARNGEDEDHRNQTKMNRQERRPARDVLAADQNQRGRKNEISECEPVRGAEQFQQALRLRQPSRQSLKTRRRWEPRNYCGLPFDSVHHFFITTTLPRFPMSPYSAQNLRS